MVALKRTHWGRTQFKKIEKSYSRKEKKSCDLQVQVQMQQTERGYKVVHRQFILASIKEVSAKRKPLGRNLEVTTPSFTALLSMVCRNKFARRASLGFLIWEKDFFRMFCKTSHLSLDLNRI